MCDADNLNHPDLQWDSSGQSGLSGDLLALFRGLDRAVLKLVSAYPVKEHFFPALIPISELTKVDYLHSFPQHASFPVHMDPNHENLEAFRKKAVVDDVVQLTTLSPVKEILTPAACYHFYIHYQTQKLDAPLYLTTKCRCFRHEEYYKPLERQWNFSMREIVCLGSMDEIQAFISAMRAKTEEFIESLGLPVSWDTATDAFFDPSNNPKYLMQKLQPNKTEMIFNGRLAIGSINLHRNYFGESFSITRQDEPAHSACVAFGLERWVAAILHHFGPERSNWPTPALGMAND